MKRNHSTILVGVIVFFYVFAPNSGGVNPQNKSTIVEIIYVFTQCLNYLIINPNLH